MRLSSRVYFSLLLSCLVCPIITSLAHGEEVKKIMQAKATINPISGQKVKGIVTFEQTKEGVKIVADLEGLSPGKHGFHIHEHGDCGSDGAAAGGHFNPSKSMHGGPDSFIRHAGDLGNVVADSKGNAHYERVDAVIQLNGPQTVVGRSIIVHEKEDDFVTQPTGASGNRIGCGVIEASNP